MIAHEHCSALLPWQLYPQHIEFDPLPCGSLFLFEFLPAPRTTLQSPTAFEVTDKWVTELRYTMRSVVCLTPLPPSLSH